MTIQEVIKSEKPFRHKTHQLESDWILPHKSFEAVLVATYRHILSNDWEIKQDPPKKVEITLEQLHKIYQAIKPVDIIARELDLID